MLAMNGSFIIILLYIDQRLHDFVVGLTNRSFEEFRKTETIFLTRCASHTGIVGRGVSVELMCDPGPVLGRYLVVQIPYTTETLTLCEVQVFGSKYYSQRNYVLHLEYHSITNNLIIYSTLVTSQRYHVSSYVVNLFSQEHNFLVMPYRDIDLSQNCYLNPA